MMGTLARPLDALSLFLFRLALIGAVAAVLVMVFSAGWQVIARYALNAPPIWAEELARRAMVWAGMLGASCAFRAQADPVLFPKARDVTGAAGNALVLVRLVGVILFSAPVIWFSLFDGRMNIARGFLGRSAMRQAEMLDVPMIWFTVAVPLAFVIIIIHALSETATRLSGQMPVSPLKSEG